MANKLAEVRGCIILLGSLIALQETRFTAIVFGGFCHNFVDLPNLTHLSKAYFKKAVGVGHNSLVSIQL